MLMFAASTSRASLMEQPTARGFSVRNYAVVPGPMALTFGRGGELYVGHEPAEDGVGEARIYRVLPDGEVQPFGPPIGDPDAVLFDAAGVIASRPDSVLVGGIDLASLGGAIHAIDPGGAATAILGPSDAFFNPSDMILLDDGRLLFTDFNQNDVKATTGDEPQRLFEVEGPGFLAYDARNDRLYTSARRGKISVHRGDGTLVEEQLVATGRRAGLAIGADDRFFGHDLYTVSGGGELLRITAGGDVTVIGDGFGRVKDVAFGPDGNLYASQFDVDRILQIRPAPFILGDMNGNGVVDAFDVDDFELALADRAAFNRAHPQIEAAFVGDIDGNGVLNSGDVAPFERLLASTGGPAAPEPGVAGVVACGAFLMTLRRREHAARRCGGNLHSGVGLMET